MTVMPLHGLLQHRHQRVGVIGRNRDGVDLLRDQRIDHFDLRFGGRLGRTGVDDVDIAEFLSRLFGALVGGIEEAVAERLHHQRDLHVLGVGCVHEHGGGKRRCNHQFLQKAHRISSLERCIPSPLRA